nr:MAG TPA: Galactose-inhibitable lectin 35 kDa subunit [Caudoviricetes sp.]
MKDNASMYCRKCCALVFCNSYRYRKGKSFTPAFLFFLFITI